MNAKLVLGSMLVGVCALAAACTITTERPADSSPPPSPPPPVPTVAPPPPPTTAAPALPPDVNAPVPLDAGAAASDAGVTEEETLDGGADAGVEPPKKKPLPRREKVDAGAATGDGGS